MGDAADLDEFFAESARWEGTEKMGRGGKEPCSMGHGRCIRETDRAILVDFGDEDDDGGEEVWIPKSVVHDDSEVYEDGGTGEVIVETWWAEANGHA